jgi:hypothetical protein
MNHCLMGAKTSALDHMFGKTCFIHMQRTASHLLQQCFEVEGQTVNAPSSRPNHVPSVGLRTSGYCLAIGSRLVKVASAIGNQQTTRLWHVMAIASRKQGGVSCWHPRSMPCLFGASLPQCPRQAFLRGACATLGKSFD